MARSLDVQGGFGVQIVGDKELMALFAALGKLDNRKRNTVVRRSLGIAARPIRKNARARVPVETGLLKKSIGIKTKTYRHSGASVALVGPRHGFKVKVGEKRATLRQALKSGSATKDVFQDPTKYAHLVEKHKPFLKPAFDNSTGSVTASLKKNFAKGLIKLAKRGGK